MKDRNMCYMSKIPLKSHRGCSSSQFDVYLIGDLDKQTEAFRWFEQQSGGDVQTEVFGLRAGLHLKRLKTDNGNLHSLSLPIQRPYPTHPDAFKGIFWEGLTL